MLPFFYRHYEKFVDHFYVFDNGSTDGSLDFLRTQGRTTVAPFKTINNCFGDTERELSDRMWKQSIGRTDWVIIIDLDEHLDHPDLPGYLAQCRKRGITALQTIGYDMITETFPPADALLAEHVVRGIRSIGYDKMCIFDPNALTETFYGGGRHVAAPTGRVVWPRRREIRLLHFKRLGADYVVRRHRQLRDGLGGNDLLIGLGLHYLWKPEETRAEFEAILERARPLPPFDDPIGDIDMRDELSAAQTIRDSGLFDADYYLARQPDVRDANVDPLLHFCTHGWQEGRKPNYLFDTNWYRQRYMQPDAADINPLLYYIRMGEPSGHQPGPLFDPQAYCMARRLAPGVSPLRHHLDSAKARRQHRAERRPRLPAEAQVS